MALVAISVVKFERPFGGSGQLKYFVIISEDKHKSIEFDYTGDYKFQQAQNRLMHSTYKEYHYHEIEDGKRGDVSLGIEPTTLRSTFRWHVYCAAKTGYLIEQVGPRPQENTLD